MHYGNCSDDSELLDSDNIGELAQCVTQSINQYYNSSFFWTARNEFEARWSYVRSWDNAWINTTAIQTQIPETNNIFKLDNDEEII